MTELTSAHIEITKLTSAPYCTYWSERLFRNLLQASFIAGQQRDFHMLESNFSKLNSHCSISAFLFQIRSNKWLELLHYFWVKLLNDATLSTPSSQSWSCHYRFPKKHIPAKCYTDLSWTQNLQLLTEQISKLFRWQTVGFQCRPIDTDPLLE